MSSGRGRRTTPQKAPPAPSAPPPHCVGRSDESMNHRVVHIGMLGSGFVADFYMDGLRDVPGTEVVANYSRSEERAREFGRRYDVPRQYTTVEDLCADREVELVVIGLPNHLHLPAVRAAAAARKAIVCTKPLARNGHEAAEMVSLVRDAGVMHGYAETE